MKLDLRLGAYADALTDVECDALICDPPYSARTHRGHDAGTTVAKKAGWKRSDGRIDAPHERREISYAHWSRDDIAAFVGFWAPRNRGWFVCFSDSDLCSVWRDCFEVHGLTGFQPIPLVVPGMTVRMSGDGPSSWATYANVARPKSLSRWGTLRGAYVGGQGDREHVGGKPLWAMRAVVRDYSRPGDLVCDPCAGAATTLIAAEIENRRSVGAEIDARTFEMAQQRIARGFTRTMFDESGCIP